MDDYDYKQVKNKEEFKHYLNNMMEDLEGWKKVFG